MEAVERFRASLRDAGMSVPEQGYEASVIGALEHELRPLRLPAGLRELWAKVPVGRLGLGPDSAFLPAFTTWFADLSLSWWLWRAIRDRPGLMPEALLPVVFCGEVIQLVELAADGMDGGRVFEWRRGTGALEVVYPSVETWLGTLTDLVSDESARLLRISDEARWLVISIDRERELRHPPVMDAIVAGDRETWPMGWQEVSRKFDDRRARRKRELSISEFLWDLPETATVAGVLRWGTSEPGPARLQLADGTAWLDVWCPAELPGLWLTEFEVAVEFDLTVGVPAWPPSLPTDPEWPAYPPHATATCLRLRTFG